MFADSSESHPSVKIHKYQSKAVLARFSVPVPARRSGVLRGGSRRDRAHAWHLHRRREGTDPRGRPWQGRRREAREVTRRGRAAGGPDAGHDIVTHQTGPEGKKVGRVLIEEGLQINRELYLSMLVDRGAQAPVVIASAAGGMDIEEVAATTPRRSSRSTSTAAPESCRSRRGRWRSRSGWTASWRARW